MPQRKTSARNDFFLVAKVTPPHKYLWTASVQPPVNVVCCFRAVALSRTGVNWSLELGHELVEHFILENENHVLRLLLPLLSAVSWKEGQGY